MDFMFLIWRRQGMQVLVLRAYSVGLLAADMDWSLQRRQDRPGHCQFRGRPQTAELPRKGLEELSPKAA